MPTAWERLAAEGLALPPGHAVHDLAERPDLWGAMLDLSQVVFPELMLHDPVATEHWGRLLADWTTFQLLLLDEGGRLAAAANSAPLAWDGTDEALPEGWDAQLALSAADSDAGTTADALGALSITVAPERQGSGLSRVMLEAMRANARAHGMRRLIACVRPTEKARHPLVPIEQYARWTRLDGLPVDPWLRVHVRLGGRIVRASPASMTIRGTVEQWHAWTGLDFPARGEYVPDGAAAPVHVDPDADEGVYLDPNVWVVHAL